VRRGKYVDKQHTADRCGFIADQCNPRLAAPNISEQIMEVWADRNFGAGTHHPDYALAHRMSVLKLLRKKGVPRLMFASTHNLTQYRVISIKPTLEMTFCVSDL
jgi:hypothetical protein